MDAIPGASSYSKRLIDRQGFPFATSSIIPYELFEALFLKLTNFQRRMKNARINTKVGANK